MSGYGDFITKLARDLTDFLRGRPDVDLEAIDHLTPLPTFDLGKARTDKKIYNRSGCRIFITSLTGTAFIRTRRNGEKYSLFKGSMSFPFRELYLTNTAQAGKTLSVVIGLQSFVDLDSAPDEIKLKDEIDSIINPATQEKQDSLIGRLDLKQSQLLTALTDTKIEEETDKVLSAGQEYEFIALTGLYIVNRFFVRSPSTNFSVIVSVSEIDILDKTYTELFDFTSHLKDVVAFPEVDNDGILTGRYVVILKSFNSDTHISIRIKNNSGANMTFDQLFCKYKKAV